MSTNIYPWSASPPHRPHPLPASGERVGVRGLALAQTAEQPRRDRGEAEPEPFPDPAGTATFDAATSTLSVPALPAHATSLRAFRQPLGGTAELAGTSTTTTVSVLAAGPLSPGVTYEFWLVGHNFQGDGAESNHVTHAVPVGP